MNELEQLKSEFLSIFDGKEIDFEVEDVDYDLELCHHDYDNILCKVALSTTLTTEERIELVRIFNNTAKWYA
jgi:cupin superfamily acireductone dioxygenase involved in methionine salvage